MVRNVCYELNISIKRIKWTRKIGENFNHRSQKKQSREQLSLIKTSSIVSYWIKENKRKITAENHTFPISFPIPTRLKKKPDEIGVERQLLLTEISTNSVVGTRACVYAMPKRGCRMRASSVGGWKENYEATSSTNPRVVPTAHVHPIRWCLWFGYRAQGRRPITSLATAVGVTSLFSS